MGKRKQYLHLIIGGNGTGKTTFQIKIAIDYIEKNPHKRVLFIVSDDGEQKLWDVEEITLEELGTFTGIKKLIIDDASDFEYIAEYYRPYRHPVTGERMQRRFNGLMCCDDLGGAMNRRPREIINFFKKRRQPNIDFLFAFHGLHTDVPPAFYTYINHIFLFQTGDEHEGTMQYLRYDKREYFEKCYFHVQEKSKTEPHYCKEIIINPLTI